MTLKLQNQCGREIICLSTVKGDQYGGVARCVAVRSERNRAGGSGVAICPISTLRHRDPRPYMMITHS